MSSNTKNGWKSFEFKTGFIGNYYILPTYIISPETWEMMVKAVKKMEEKENGNKM
tara:strand:- start:668 stop:832 length:165 start_codon:yes stop_codon:yes gene_type:complete